MKKVVVLCSGGLDSTVCAYLAQGAGHTAYLLGISYGQPAAAAESRATLELARRLGVARSWVDAGEVYLGEMTAPPGVRGARIVPGRNLILLALAANFAGVVGAREIWLGVHAGDSPIYPDCRAEFVTAAGAALQIAEGITLQAPLLGYTRSQVRDLAAALGVDRSQVWSCYSPRDGLPCRECDSCLQDPT